MFRGVLQKKIPYFSIVVPCLRIVNNMFTKFASGFINDSKISKYLILFLKCDSYSTHLMA